MSTASRPWLSILLPVYKVQDYLPACAESILSQADEGVELLFVDDASPDRSADIVDGLAASDSRVRLIRHERNQCVSAARNTLLDAARGDYLWFIDPDDLMEPGAIPALRRIVHETRPDLVMCDFRRFDDGDPRPQKAKYAHIASFAGDGSARGAGADALLRGLFACGQLHPWTKIVRRAAWPAGLRFPVGRIFEDLAVYPRLALGLQSFVHVPEVWVAYRQRAGSALSALDAERLEQWTQALDGFAAELDAIDIPISDATRLQIAHYCARSFVRAAKRRVRLKAPGEAEALWRFVQCLRAASPLGPQQLMQAYLRQGRLLRWLQLRYWLRRADGPSIRAA